MPDPRALPVKATGKYPTTWRERIRAAADAVDTAYVFRCAEFTRAHDAGFSFRQIAEAAGMTASSVHKITGNRGDRRVSLDSLAPDEDRRNA